MSEEMDNAVALFDLVTLIVAALHCFVYRCCYSHFRSLNTSCE